VTATLEGRLDRAAAAARVNFDRRWKAANDTLFRALTPEHRRIIADWFAGSPPLDGPPCPFQHRPSPHFCDRCIDSVNPPALIKAMWRMVVAHVMTGAPVALPPEVAQIYVDDPDAVPARPCDRCGYLLPMRAKLRADRTYRFLASYDGPCPVCETDTGDDASAEGDR
jgi:hypothetical protein